MTCTKLKYNLSFVHDRFPQWTRLAGALRRCRLPGRTLHDAASCGCRLFRPPAGPSPEGRQHRANTPRHLSPGPLSAGRTRGPRGRVAVGRIRGSPLAPNGTLTTRPFRFTAGANPSHAAVSLAATTPARAERPLSALRRRTWQRTHLG